MTHEPTQHQTDAEHDRSQQLSLQPTTARADVPGVQLSRLLGTGAYGEVWVGIDKKTNRQVADKFFNHQSGVDWQLLSKEVEKLVSLATERHVVQLLDVGWEADPPYYVMEFLEAGSLDRFIENQESISISDAVDFFHGITTGLAHAHNKGILHCDLKPANILLDSDRRPRLADFGQSRLSTDQSPALGTLFYMAPEQADLNASPDARWDVYGLGAILYTLLEGTAPHQSPEELQRIESAGNLEQRLLAYRTTMKQSGNPTDGILRHDIDPPLKQILRKCLEVDPQNRFASVRDILDALHQRTRARQRRPLTILGIFGPLILLAIMAFFSFLWYQQSVADAEQAVRERVYESNAWVSRHVALSVEDEIRSYYDIVEFEAKQAVLSQLISTVLNSQVLANIHTDQQPWETITPAQRQFVNDPHRIPLDQYLQKQIRTYETRLALDQSSPKIASLFIVSPQGDMLGIAFSKGESAGPQSIGRYYGFRNYFHGKAQDLPRDTPVDQVTPIVKTHLSRAFQSTTTYRWKIAITTPVYESAEPDANLIGIMALTLNLGDFSYLRNKRIENQFAVFIDGRSDNGSATQRTGTILQHPAMDEFQTPSQRPFQLSTVQLTDLMAGTQSLYIDPVGEQTGLTEYQGQWIAVMEPVRLPGSTVSDSGAPLPSEVNRERSDLLILVQESYQQATLPIRELGRKLILEGIFAAAVILIVVSTLWFFVIRKFSQTAPFQPLD